MNLRIYEPVAIAGQFKFVRETLGANKGVFVEAFQRIGDGRPGDSWCADFLSLVLWVCYQGPAPLPRTGSCAAMYEVARQSEWLVPVPLADDVFFYVDGTGHAHHVGLVTSVAPLMGISGNTSPDGLSSNGDGVHEHNLNSLSSLQFARLPLHI